MQNGGQKTLADRLKEKTEQERQEVEKIVEKSFQNFSKKLMESSIKELTTIENAIRTKAEEATSNLSLHYKILSIAHSKEWFRSLILTIAMMTGLAIASWGAFQGLAYWVRLEMNELNEIQTKIYEQQQTVNYLKKDTFGIYLMEELRGKFIVLPKGYTVETKWSNGERKFLKRVKN